PKEAAPTSAKVSTTLQKIIFVFDATANYDYNYNDNAESPLLPSGRPLKLCNYNRCRDKQIPCEELMKKEDCLCPGVTGPKVQPDPPRIQEVIASRSTASIHWCAPTSTVEGYFLIYRKVEVQDVMKTPVFNQTTRIETLSGLDFDTSYFVCVVASNKAGTSPIDLKAKQYGPCHVFQTKPRFSVWFFVGLVAILVLLVIIIGVAAWHCRLKRKSPRAHGSLATITTLAGVANPSFNSEGTF
uniref:LRRN4 C-terminal like n=1 Tax=Latimeria chalumnae TaxID=7897 RepID=H3BDU6_LATCH